MRFKNRFGTFLGMGLAALLASGVLVACSDDDGGVNNNNNNENINDNNNNNNNNVTPPEVCNDASDNDGDGLTDCRDPDCAAEPACTLSFTILQTSDLHNHAAGYGNASEYTPLDTTDNDPSKSGFARIATIIGTVKAQKAAAGTPVLTFDSGDWLSGTLFDLAVQSPIALMFFQAMGYTAITIGNHDTDWSPDGLAMLYANAMDATPLGFTVPVVQTNLVFDPVDTGDDNMEALKAAGLIREKLVVDLPNGLKVGVLGRMGEEPAGQTTAAGPMTWDATDTAGAGFAAYWQGKVNDLRDTDGVDVVIMVAHGQFKLSGTSEDRTLATLVDGIDFIAAGHSHTYSDAPVIVGKTMIFEPGRYGEYVSQVDATYNLATRTVDSSALTMHVVDDTVTGDATTAYIVDQYIAGIDAALAPLGVTYDASVAQLDSDFDLSLLDDAVGENQFGNLCADAFRTVATGVVVYSADPTPVDVAVVPAGVVRDGLYYGNTGIVSFADTFAALPTGVSPFDANLPVGWPLVSVYLTGPELRDAAEVNALVASGMAGATAQLYFSGMRYHQDTTNPMFLTVWRVDLCGNTIPQTSGGDGDFFSINCDPIDIYDDVTLYRVVVDLYTFMMLGLAAESSFHNLSIVPKDVAGVPIDPTNPAALAATRVDADPATGGVQELKEWMVLSFYLTSGIFGDPQLGVPEIPAAVYGPGGIAFGRATQDASGTP